MSDPREKLSRVVTGAGALGLAIRAEVDDEHQEVKRVNLFGAPVFRRTEEGYPVVLGIKFPRWIRGPRKS